MRPKNQEALGSCTAMYPWGSMWGCSILDGDDWWWWLLGAVGVWGIRWRGEVCESVVVGGCLGPLVAESELGAVVGGRLEEACGAAPDAREHKKDTNVARSIANVEITESTSTTTKQRNGGSLVMCRATQG